MSARPITDLIAEIWPKDTPQADLSLPIALAAKPICQAKSGLATINRIAEASANAPEIVLLDMPDTVLDSRLGELCDARMSGFPRAYAWHALLAVASVLVPRVQGTRVNSVTGGEKRVHFGG